MIARALQTSVIFALCLLAFPAFASETYKVTVKLSHGGEEFASPTFVAKSGEKAKVTVSGTNGYTLAVTVDPLPDGKLKVSLNLHSRFGDMSPVLVVRPNTTAPVSVGGLSLILAAAPNDG